ncbi:MAG: NTP transferase domain-containing protein [Bacteroidetes bacterium]|jgi:NDP-sugar pyrophosphorylase family protein|nr:NTP transferase domain-containing protein [Bacteroidota bacterium]
MKAMILAAGIGSRLKPLTLHKPKALIKINHKPLIQYAIEHLMHYGVTEVIINIHHLGEQIIEFIHQNNSFGLHIEFSDESYKLLNTGGGLVKAAPFLQGHEPFFLYASDVITNINLEEMMHFHNLYHPLATLAVKNRQTSRSLLFDNENRLCGWTNNQTKETRISRKAQNHTSLGFSGIHLIDPVIFDLFEESGAFNITDAYIRLAQDNTIMGFRDDNHLWFEFGRYERIRQTEQEIINKKFQL